MVPATRASPAPIDVWDCTTFDGKLLEELERGAADILGYFETDHRTFLNHDLDRGPRRSILRPSNPHWSRYSAIREGIAERMEGLTIRAWHYTRLIDAEVDVLRREGIHLSTPESLRRRLDAVVAAGAISAETADQLFAESPFHSDQHDVRVNRFWMTSHPTAVDDGGVTPLMAHWGGEVASMWTRDDALIAPLKNLGLPRILEIAVPLSSADCAHEAAEAMVAAFARTRGGIPGKKAFDLRVTTPLPSDAVLGVHTRGEAAFENMGRSFPRGFVDVDIGRWKELTGEDD